MGGFGLDWHYEGCSQWDSYVNAGRNPQAPMPEGLSQAVPPEAEGQSQPG